MVKKLLVILMILVMWANQIRPDVTASWVRVKALRVMKSSRARTWLTTKLCNSLCLTSSWHVLLQWDKGNNNASQTHRIKGNGAQVLTAGGVHVVVVLYCLGKSFVIWKAMFLPTQKSSVYLLVYFRDTVESWTHGTVRLLFYEGIVHISRSAPI